MCGLAQPGATAPGDEGATEEHAGVMRTAGRQGWPRRPRLVKARNSSTLSPPG